MIGNKYKEALQMFTTIYPKPLFDGGPSRKGNSNLLNPIQRPYSFKNQNVLKWLIAFIIYVYGVFCDPFSGTVP